MSRPGILFLARLFRHMSYVFWSKYLCSGVCGLPLLFMTNPSRSCHGSCLTSFVHFSGCSGWKWHVRTVGLLLIDYCMCISLAMFSGLVGMLLFLSMIQSSGGVSWFLKIFLFIFFGLVSYSCLYFDMAFLMLSKVCFVVILRTWVLAGLARLANVLIMSCWLISWSGGGGMVL